MSTKIRKKKKGGTELGKTNERRGRNENKRKENGNRIDRFVIDKEQKGRGPGMMCMWVLIRDRKRIFNLQEKKTEKIDYD